MAFHRFGLRFCILYILYNTSQRLARRIPKQMLVLTTGRLTLVKPWSYLSQTAVVPRLDLSLT